MTATEALDKLRTICSRQEKSPADATALLHKWDIDGTKWLEIIDQLKLENYIDEKRYARAFVTDKIRFDHWGLIKIKIMLGRKGISKAVVESVIHEADRDEYHKMISMELSKKRRSLKGTPYERKAKLIRYGLSKGYEMHDMEGLLGEAQEEANEW